MCLTHVDQVRTRLRKPAYDAVVVGTGFGGAVAACRLAQ
jgi:choline dehydrogenase-like flavoprotein